MSGIFSIPLSTPLSQWSNHAIFTSFLPPMSISAQWSSPPVW
jgi:hypothetical protein